MIVHNTNNLYNKDNIIIYGTVIMRDWGLVQAGRHGAIGP
jgi:hypothetical protein